MTRQISLLILGLLATINVGYACTCSIINSITTDYQNAAFVATIKIKKNYKNRPANNEYYKADIEIIDLYKGTKLKSIYILGNNGGDTYNSCGTFIKEGETRLIFGSPHQGKFTTVYLCTTFHKPLESYYKRDQIREKLNLLSKFASKYTTKIFNPAYFYPVNFKKTFNPELINYFSLIRVKIDTNMMVKDIKCLTNDNPELIASFEHYFQKTINWSFIKRIPQNEIDGHTLFFEINPYTSIKQHN